MAVTVGTSRSLLQAMQRWYRASSDEKVRQRCQRFNLQLSGFV
jgi:hypothetical protein